MKEICTTVDSAVFNKLYRMYLEHYGDSEVRCARCRPHRGDNGMKGSRYSKPWKIHRKFQTRYLNDKLSLRDFNVFPDTEIEEDLMES